MKTIGLTLEETLRALVDGKAKKAEHPAAATHLILDPSRKWFQWECKGIGFTFTPSHLTPEWSLIDPVQEYEEVERVRWDIFGADGSHLRTNYKTEDIAKKAAVNFPGSRLVKMTGIDRVPKKEKVVRQIEVEAKIKNGGAFDIAYCRPFEDYPETHGKTGKLIFEWEE